VRDAVKGYLTLAASLTEVTRQRATAAAKALVAQGEATGEQVQQLVDDVLAQTRQNREAVSSLVTHEVDRTLGRFGLAASDEVTDLVERVRALESEVRDLREAATGARATADPAAADGQVAGTEAPARKAPAKKAAATKAAGKKAAGKKAAGKKAAGTTAAGHKAADGPTAPPPPTKRKRAAAKVAATVQAGGAGEGAGTSS
jgi:polyhydroxyalkanoate synthesis regulator phasin